MASGKSTVASFFKQLGATVISADHIAKELTMPGKPAFQCIVEHFGQTILSPTGELNRRRLRQLIFEDAHERRWLEQCLHPRIRKEIEARISQVQSPYCIIEIPLLTQKADYPYLDRVLLVQADEKQRISRIIARDHHSEAEARAMLATQLEDEQQTALADDILINTGSLTDLQEKISVLHDQWKAQNPSSQFI